MIGVHTLFAQSDQLNIYKFARYESWKHYFSIRVLVNPYVLAQINPEVS